LNLLQLAPGGHLGRFIVWTRAAFAKLAEIYGSVRRPSTQKKGWTVPRNIMSNSDVTRLINSDEVQSKVRAPIHGVRRAIRKKNPLRNLGALVKLNPYALSIRRHEILAEKRRAEVKKAKLAAAREKKAFPETKEAQNEAALARAHEPQQRENYKRLVLGEAYKRPVDKEGKAVDKIAFEVTSRPKKKGVLPKGPKKEKKKKVKAKKEEEKKEEKKGPIDWASRPMPKMPVMKREPRVKKVKKEGGDGGKKGGKGAKGEKGKGEAGKGEAAKGEAAKGGEKAKGGKAEAPKGKAEATKKEGGGKGKAKG